MSRGHAIQSIHGTLERLLLVERLVLLRISVKDYSNTAFLMAVEELLARRALDYNNAITRLRGQWAEFFHWHQARIKEAAALGLV